LEARSSTKISVKGQGGTVKENETVIAEPWSKIGSSGRERGKKKKKKGRVNEKKRKARGPLVAARERQKRGEEPGFFNKGV